MTQYNYDKIKDMISSPDKENSYLAACLLRKDKSSYCKELLKKIPVQDRIKVIDDIYEELGMIKSVVKENLTKQEKSLIAFSTIQLISKVLNEDWVEDWNNTKQYKYYPYFRKTSSGWVLLDRYYFDVDSAKLGFGFYYKNPELALFAGNTFLLIYVDYLPL